MNSKHIFFLFFIIMNGFIEASNTDSIIQKNNDREYWVNTMIKIADPVLFNLSKSELKKNIPNNTKSDSIRAEFELSHIEAFSRTFCGLAPWLGLDLDKTNEGILREKYLNLTLKCFSNFLNPNNPDYCNFGSHKQTLLEAGYISLGFLSSSNQLWTKLDKLSQDRFLFELKKTRTIEPHDNNFLLFQSIIELFILDKTGKCDYEKLHHGVNRFFKDFYVGDGYYSDGPLFTMDYYNSYIIHPMMTKALLILKDKNLTDDTDYNVQIKRHQRFSEILERLISPTGHYPLIGRTISCRIGAFHALSQAAQLKILPKTLRPSQVRSALTAVLKTQFSNDQNFDNENWLVLGFNGKQPALNESYINTGSLYQAMVFFTALGLPETNSFWKAPFTKWTSYKAFSGEKTHKDKAFIEYSNFSLIKKAKLRFSLSDNYLIAICVLATSSISFILGLYYSKFKRKFKNSKK